MVYFSIFSKGKFDAVSNSWDGMIGMAANGQVDMIAADLTMTTKRHEVLEFTVPFMAAQVTVLLKKEKRHGGRGGRHGGGNGVKLFIFFHDLFYFSI